MRGPLESLIGQAQQEQIPKSASPIAFCRATPHLAYCIRRARRYQFGKNFNMVPKSLLGKCLADSLDPPLAMGARCDGRNHYPIR